MSRRVRRSGRQVRPLAVLTAAAAAAALLPLKSNAATATFDNGGTDKLWSNSTNWNPDGAVDGNDARFDGTTGSTVQPTVTSIVDANRSVLSLSYTQHATSNTTTGDTIFHTTQINDGATLTITGNSGPTSSALQVGSTIDNLANNNLTYTSFVNQPGAVTGGTLAINNALADIIVRQCSSNTAGGSRMATLDLSGLSNFNATVRNINIAVGDASGSLNRAVGTMILAKNNTINANSIVVGFNPQNGTTQAVPGKLVFGQNNTINTNSITIGGRVTPGNQAGFNSAVSNGSLVIRGAGGIGRSDLFIGTQPVGDVVATSNTNNLVDLAGGSGYGTGTIDAKIEQLNIGRAGFASNATGTARNASGTFNFSSGLVDCNSIFIGDDNNTNNAAGGTGTVTVSGTGRLLANTTFSVARKQNAGSSSTATGTLNISGAGASARSLASITDGGGTSTINITSGSLQARGLGSAANPIDNLNMTGGTFVVDISSGLPAGNWGYVTNLTANGANIIGLQLSGLPATGTFQGISYAGTIGGGGFAAFSMAKQPARVTAHLVNNPNSIDISIDTADAPKWDGTVNGDWDIQDKPSVGGGTANWKLINAATATKYQEDLATYSTTDSVLFDDTATGTTAVNVATTVAPNAITVNNSTKAYSFSGTGKITGDAGIIKKGSNALTIGNTGGNDFSGTIDVQAGTLNTSANEVLPNSAVVTVESGATFDLTTHSETVGSVILSGGNITANAGTLTAGNITVSGGNFTAGSGTVAANTMTVSGGSVTAGTGSLTAGTLNINNGASIAPGGGNISATTINLNDGTLGVGNISPTAITASKGTIDSTYTGSGTLSKIGTDTVTITGNNSYSGQTTLNDGILRITNSNALGSATGSTTIDNAGATSNVTLELAGGINVPEPVTLNGRRGTGSATTPYNFNPDINNHSDNNTWSGTVTLNTGGTNYTLASDAGTLTVTGNIVNPISATPTQSRNLVLRGASNGVITGDIQRTAASNPDDMTITKMDAGTWTLSGNVAVMNGTHLTNDINNQLDTGTTIEGGKLVFNTPTAYQTSNLEIRSNANGEIAATPGGSHVVTVGTLIINSNNAKLDIQNNKLISHNLGVGTASGGFYGDMSGYIQQGRNGGGWTGTTGIVTSQTAATTGSLTSIGVASAQQVKGLAGTGDTAVWAGVTVTGSDTLVMYTYGGDANLDGKINVDDYGRIDSSIPLGIAGWYNGDFNYDGKINVDDYGIIDSNIGIQGAPFPAAGGSAGLSGVSAVPEPASLLTTAATLLTFATTRRRRRRG